MRIRGRTVDQCRERWVNILDPRILDRKVWSVEVRFFSSLFSLSFLGLVWFGRGGRRRRRIAHCLFLVLVRRRKRTWSNGTRTKDFRSAKSLASNSITVEPTIMFVLLSPTAFFFSPACFLGANFSFLSPSTTSVEHNTVRLSVESCAKRRLRNRGSVSLLKMARAS